MSFVQQQYIDDPASSDERERLASQIELLERARADGGDAGGEITAVIDSLRAQLQFMQPRVVSYDPRLHS